MTIEVLDMRITNRDLGTVRLTATDVSEEHIQYLERYRDDGFEKEVIYEWNTKDSKQFYWLRRWLKEQRSTQNSKTFGDAMKAVVGSIVQSPSGRYRIYDI